MPKTFASLKNKCLSGSHILVVDDDIHLRQVMVGILTNWGVQCHGVPSAEEALETVAGGSFDAIVLDLHLPGMSGLTFMKELRAQEKHELLPVLMVTGDPTVAVKRSAFASGVDSFMLKPFDAESLLLALSGMLSKKRILATFEKRANLLLALGQTIEAKDPYTIGHSDRVALYSRNMGEVMGLDEEQIQTLGQGGLLHDIGKIGVDESLLHKNGPLTTSERLRVETHPVQGATIVGNLATMVHTLPMIRSHHERCDGSGYPDGLRKDEIPLLARITAYADVYDALTSRRPYRDAFSSTRAMEIIRTDAARGLLDSDLLGYFEEVARRNEEQALLV